MENFEIRIASVPDREGLVAEIWRDNTLFAEIWQTKNGRRITFYADRAELDFDALTAVLAAAAERLAGEKLGIALLPEYTARRPAWRRVLPDWQIESVPLHLLYYKNRGSVPVVRTFVEFVLEKVREAA